MEIYPVVSAVRRWIGFRLDGKPILLIPQLPGRKNLTENFEAFTSVSERWPVYHVDALDELPKRNWLIEGKIPENGLTVLYGAPGSGKSFLALEYCLQLAQDMAVVYIAAEGSGGYPKRVSAWRQTHEPVPLQLQFIFEEVPLLDERLATAFVEQLKRLRPKLVVVDTLARCFNGGDENSSKDMGQFIRACGCLQRDLNTAVLVVHHTGKAGDDERGSSALRGAADSMMALKRTKDVLRLSSSKTKDSEPFAHQYYALQSVALPDGETSCVLVPMAAQPRPQQTDGDRRLLEALVERPLKASELSQQLNLTSGPVYAALNRLEAEGYAMPTGHGKREWWYVQETLNTAVLFVHTVASDRPDDAGFGMLRNLADNLLHLTETDAVLHLASTKARDSQRLPDRFYRRRMVQLPTGESSCVLVPYAEQPGRTSP